MAGGVGLWCVIDRFRSRAFADEFDEGSSGPGAEDERGLHDSCGGVFRAAKRRPERAAVDVRVGLGGR